MRDNDLRAIVLSVIVFSMALTAYHGLQPTRPSESFSELAILGPEGRATGYPREIPANQEFLLYLYVGNHEGKVTYYRILTKLGNRSLFVNETIPMEAPVIEKHEQILIHNQTWMQSITLSIEKPGVNQLLVFEMWIYDSDLHDFKYHGIWNQLWITVTTYESTEEKN